MTRVDSRPLFGVLLACVVAAPSQAQVVRPRAAHRLDSWRASADTAPATDAFTAPLPARDSGSARAEIHYASGAVGGIGGAMLGLYLGAAVGGKSSGSCAGDWCGLEAAIRGAFVGEAVGLALGTHFGSGAQGNGLLSTAVSVGLMTVAVRAAERPSGPLHNASAPMIIAVPIVQIAAVLVAETMTSHNRPD